MAFDLDPCRVYSEAGELVAEGFVQRHDGDYMLVEAENYTDVSFGPGDAAIVEVLSAHRGACTYDGGVRSRRADRIELDGLELREVVQQRSAVRVPTSIHVTVTHRVVDRRPELLAEPLRIEVIDVSGYGLRFRCAEEVEPGTVLDIRLDATRIPLDLRAQVLRTLPLGTDLAHGCQFVDLGERESDELFHFVLEEQRRQLAERAGSR